MKWQVIYIEDEDEFTAPTNEVVLLAWLEVWPKIEWKIETGFARHGEERNKSGISSISIHGQATHWMPLPDPPEVT